MSDAEKKDKQQSSEPAEASEQQEEKQEKETSEEAPSKEQPQASAEEEASSADDAAPAEEPVTHEDQSEEQTGSSSAPKKLMRSQTNRTIAGVCGGVAEYFGLDVTLVRVGWFVATIFTIGLPAYIVAWIVMPEQDPGHVPPAELKEKSRERSRNAGLIIGGILIFLGAVILADNLHFYFPFRWLRYNFDYIFSIALIGLGVFLIFNHKKSQSNPVDSSDPASGSAPKTSWRFERSVSDKKIGGVCGGLAEHFNVDSTIVRIAFIVLALITQVIPALIAYGLAMVLLPEHNNQDALAK